MARQRVTRQELNRRKFARGFVGRAEKLTLFRDNLGRNPQDEDFQYLFHVHGNAGVGKTSLVRQWETAAQAREAVTVYLDDDVHDPLEAMEAVSVQMERQGLPLRAFQDLLATYRLRRHEAEAAPVALAAAETPGPGQQASATGTFLAQAGVLGLGLLPVPGAGALAGLLDAQRVAEQVDHGAERLRAVVASRLRSHDDVQLVVSPLRVLTPVFLQDLAKAAERRPWLVLFFDVFERTGPLLDEWLPDVLVGEEHGALPLNVIAVLSGQGQLDHRRWGDHRRLVWDVPLEVFTEQEARELLTAHGVHDEQVVEVVLRLTGRLPVLVDLLAQTRPQGPTDVEDPADTAVDRFLKWVTDAARRDAALACALPLQLNEDVYRAAVPEAAADQYTWLRGLPFVTGREGRARYHDVVRTPMLRLQRGRSAARWQQQHLRLADTYRRWRQDRTAAAAPGGTEWEDPESYEYRLNEAYHRLCAHPVTAWPDTLAQLVEACDRDDAALRRWAQVLVQAGHDTEHPALIEWGDRLRTAAGEHANGDVAALTQLLTAPELTLAARALAHTLRGRDHRQAGRYDHALTDYAAALALDPDLARAHYGRGETHRLAGHYEQALTSLDRAVELEPGDAANPTSRAQTYSSLERYDEALADHDLAVRAAPDDEWILARRGLTHQALGRYEEAFADFDRVVQLSPAHPWALTNRGLAHRFLERYEEAFADFDRALQLDPGYAWAAANRGELHVLLERYEEALADHDLAISLDPESAWALACRGQTHRILERYEEALADFDRAVALDPEEDWALVNRAQTYCSLKRYEEALADFDRAVTLDPEDWWNLTKRAQTHRFLERYDDALADYGRADGLDPDNALIIAGRGETHRLAGNLDEALADFDRALRSEPDYAWALTNRGLTYRSLGRYDDALADLSRVHEQGPDAHTHCELAITLRLLGRPGETEHWQAAVELFTAKAAAGPRPDAGVMGDLMAVHCAMGEWTAAAAGLDRFLACAPNAWYIREALDLLADLQTEIALDPAEVRSLRQKLEDAIPGAAPSGTG